MFYFCCTLLNVNSSIAIILVGKRELVALLNLSAWCLVMVERLFLAVPQGCLRFVIVVFPDHTHLLFLLENVIFSLPWRISLQSITCIYCKRGAFVIQNRYTSIVGIGTYSLRSRSYIILFFFAIDVSILRTMS